MNITRFFKIGHKYFSGQAQLAKKVGAQRLRRGRQAGKIPELEPRYQPERLLESTKGSRVYRGTDRESGRPVVIKRALNCHYDFLIRWESDLLERLRHPNLVGLIAGRSRYLVEEFLPGVLLERIRLTPLETLVVGSQLVNALRYLHRQDVVLRDLKTNNVMVGPDGTVKLFDLGLAKDLGRRRDLCAGDYFIGTPEFAAPELIRAGATAALPSADYFSLGVTLYRALTERFPLERAIVINDEERVVVSWPENGHPLNRQNLRDVPPFLHSLLYKLLEPEPSERLADPDLVQREILGGLAEAKG